MKTSSSGHNAIYKYVTGSALDVDNTENKMQSLEEFWLYQKTPRHCDVCHKGSMCWQCHDKKESILLICTQKGGVDPMAGAVIRGARLQFKPQRVWPVAKGTHSYFSCLASKRRKADLQVLRVPCRLLAIWRLASRADHEQGTELRQTCMKKPSLHPELKLGFFYESQSFSVS